MVVKPTRKKSQDHPATTADYIYAYREVWDSDDDVNLRWLWRDQKELAA